MVAAATAISSCRPEGERTAHQAQQETAGQAEVLQELDLLALVADVAVEQHRGQQAEAGQEECCDACLPPDDDGQPAQDLQRDHQRQQHPGHAHGFHVGLGAGVGADLADAGDDEDQGKQ